MNNKKELKAQYKQTKPEMGVFAFKCKVTGKIFIGYGQNIKADINSIKFQLDFGNYNKNDNLQRDWKVYGKENFEITVLETLDYDKNIEKNDYMQDLQALLEIVGENFDNWELIN